MSNGLTLLFFVAFTSFVNAQKKQSKGSEGSSKFLSAEVNFRPLSVAPISINYLKARLFLNKNMAIRMGFSMNTLSNTTKVAAAGLPDEETKDKYFVFGLYPGFEIHVGKNEKISPYFGGELAFSLKTSSTTITNAGNILNDKVVCKNIWNNNTNPAYVQIGLNLVSGFDFYLYKGLFMGVEVGFGFAYTINNDIEVSRTIANITNIVTTPGNKVANLGVNFNPAIRLGWTF